MALAVRTEPSPLRTDESGAIRVGKSRVPLAVFLGYYKQGYTAEELADDFPTISLADAHATIGYYLRHRTEVDAYLVEQAAEAAALRAETEANQDPGWWDEVTRRAKARGLRVS